jgi:hypothetical protein
MKQLEIGEKVDIYITRRECNQDRACDEAYKMALYELGVDDSGYANNVKGAGRAGVIHCQFITYIHSASMVGHEHLYHFQAWVDVPEDDDDE